MSDIMSDMYSEEWYSGPSDESVNYPRMSSGEVEAFQPLVGMRPQLGDLVKFLPKCPSGLPEMSKELQCDLAIAQNTTDLTERGELAYQDELVLQRYFNELRPPKSIAERRVKVEIAYRQAEAYTQTAYADPKVDVTKPENAAGGIALSLRAAEFREEIIVNRLDRLEANLDRCEELFNKVIKERPKNSLGLQPDPNIFSKQLDDCFTSATRNLSDVEFWSRHQTEKSRAKLVERVRGFKDDQSRFKALKIRFRRIELRNEAEFSKTCEPGVKRLWKK